MPGEKTTQPSGAAGAPSIAPGRPLFVGVGQNALRLISENGTDWRHKTLGKENEYFRAVTHGNGRYAAIGGYGDNRLWASSPDGVTWETGAVAIKENAAAFRSLSFVKGSFLALGGEPGDAGGIRMFSLRSQDGVHWDGYQSMEGRHMIRRVVEGNGILVGVGDFGRRIVSKDGHTWADVPNVKAVDTLIDVVFGGPPGKEVFVGAGLHGLRMTTRDGLEWTNRVAGEEGEHCNSIAWTGRQFVAVGQGGTYFSPDGIDWKRKPNSNAPTICVHGSVGGQDLFVGATWLGILQTSTDAVNWKKVYEGEHNIEALCFG